MVLSLGRWCVLCSCWLDHIQQIILAVICRMCCAVALYIVLWLIWWDLGLAGGKCIDVTKLCCCHSHQSVCFMHV